MIALNPPGGVSDTCARIIGEKLTERWGQQVVVDNRVGAGGIIGSEIVAKAPSDGHTLLLGFVGNLSINPGLYAKLPYDPQKDFAPISLVARSPIVVAVTSALPAKSIQELIALAKLQPKKIAYSSSGNGNGNHLATELFASMVGIELLHVPFKGGPPALAAVMRGDTQLMFGNAVFTVPQVKAGRVRAIAVTTERRIPLLPDVPTIAESGYKNFVVTSWFGVLAPAGTPSAIVNKLNAEIVSILSEEEVKRRFDNAALIVTPSTPLEFANLIQSETRRWTEVIRKTGTKAD
jgi:tripartite-type tricarboxylate transporter receptor subunit TctC